MSPICFSLLLPVETYAQEPAALRVGVYHNPPKILAGEDGLPDGILGQLLREMAVREGWRLTAVPCQWNDCLQMLVGGEMDLMPDVAISGLRDERFEFHQEPALLSWSQVYVPRGMTMSSLLDMDGRRVAILEGSIQQSYLSALVESFSLRVDWVSVDSFEAGFDAVDLGLADAVVANHYFGDREAYYRGLIATPIMFQPSELYFAAALGEQAVVLAAIDRYLRTWKADPGSVYYRILNEWTLNAADLRLPPWLLWLFVGAALALLLALGFIVSLRYEVNVRTRRLRASEDRLNTILNSVDAYIYIKDINLRYEYVNQKVSEYFGRPVEKIVGHLDTEFLDQESAQALQETDLEVIRDGKRVAKEESHTLPGGTHEHVFYSVKLPLRTPTGRIYGLCGISTDITELKNIRSQLHKLAFYDPLTGLPNRRLILERLSRALNDLHGSSQQGVLIVIDVDHFKQVNDTLGHYYGDLLLQLIAQRLESTLRNRSSAGRLGADEFVVLIDDLAAGDDLTGSVHEVVNDLSGRLNAVFDLQGVQHVCSVSMGVALYSDAHGQMDSLLKAADLALNAAKHSGRGNVRFFDPAMQSDMLRRASIESQLRQAIDNGALDLHLQPQYNQQRQVIGFEALMRWQDDVLGQVSPADFIPVAESSGLIVSMGEWLITRACKILAGWQQSDVLNSLTLSINISTRQFHHPNFVAYIQEQVKHHQIDASRLELEVTESLLIDDIPLTVSRMNELRALGCRFALDDFGTGYASLKYLKQLPLVQLKVDQSFVRDILDDHNDEVIVKTIIALGQSLELRVIAEGVETAQQLQRLEQLGCVFYQGYFLGRPAPEAYWLERLQQGAEQTP